MRAIATLLTLTLLAACGDSGAPGDVPERRPMPKATKPLVDEDGAPSLGSESDPSNRDTLGVSEVLRDTYLCRKNSHKLCFIRSKLYANPAQEDVDTFEWYLKEGMRIWEIKTGTRVRVLGYRSTRMTDGNTYRFARVEVLGGVIVDENGDPAHGSILTTMISEPREG